MEGQLLNRPWGSRNDNEKSKNTRVSDQNFMNLAVKEAIESTEAPFGAIVVKDGQIIGAGSHMVGSHNDITSHAEIVAIRKACSSLGKSRSSLKMLYIIGSPSLSGCSIYTSSHPCGMCLGACLYAGLTEVYYAASLREVADEGFSNNTGRINLCPFWVRRDQENRGLNWQTV